MSDTTLDLRGWIDDVSARQAGVITKGDLQISSREHPQDESRTVLESLRNSGYQTVEWDASNSSHDVCLALHKYTWTIDEFLTGLSYDAPVFERTHPGDRSCFLIVYGPEESGLDPVQVGPWPYI